MNWMARLLGLARELEVVPDTRIRGEVWQATERTIRFSRLARVLNFLILSVATAVTLSVIAAKRGSSVLAITVAALIVGLACGVVTFSVTVAEAWFRRAAYARALRTILNDRGYAICMACGYNLASLDSRNCPECGQDRQPRPDKIPDCQ